MLVAVLRVHVNDALEVAAAEDQQPVKACAPQACDPALGVRTSPRRPHGRPNHADARGAENLVEAARELRDAAALVRTLLEFRGRDDEPALPFLSTLNKVGLAAALHAGRAGRRRTPSQRERQQSTKGGCAS